MVFNPKAQLKVKKIIILFLMIIFSCFHASLSAQCENKISLVKVETTTSDINKGSIEVFIDCQGSYEVELYDLSGAGKKIIQKKSGYGLQNMIFEGLTADDNYQVLVIFIDEEQNFCKKRQISEISTLKK